MYRDHRSGGSITCMSESMILKPLLAMTLLPCVAARTPREFANERRQVDSKKSGGAASIAGDHGEHRFDMPLSHFGEQQHRIGGPCRDPWWRVQDGSAARAARKTYRAVYPPSTGSETPVM